MDNTIDHTVENATDNAMDNAMNNVFEGQRRGADNQDTCEQCDEAQVDNDSIYADCEDTCEDATQTECTPDKSLKPRASTRQAKKRKRTDYHPQKQVAARKSLTETKIDSLIQSLAEAEKRLDSKIAQIADKVGNASQALTEKIDDIVNKTVDVKVNKVSDKFKAVTDHLEKRVEANSS